MRGRRRTVAAVLAEAFAKRPGAEPPAIAAAFAEACGPALARNASCRGLLKDGRLLVLARSQAWADQLAAAAPLLCERVNARLGRRVTEGLEIRLAPER
jgi:predicted nucleic acid-binding Zn ribbon protein